MGEGVKVITLPSYTTLHTDLLDVYGLLIYLTRSLGLVRFSLRISSELSSS